MNDKVWISRNSWDNLFALLSNIQIRQNPSVAKATAHFTETGSGARLFLDLPDYRKGYDGPFKVALKTDGTLKIFDGGDPESEYAGDAWINGIFREIPAGTISSAQVVSGYVCLVLNTRSQVSFKIRQRPMQHHYDGEFAVDFSASTGQLNVFDGSFKSGSGTAGHAFLNGTWTSIPSGSLTLKNGYLCLKYSAAGVSYEIVNNPKRLI